LDRSEAIIWLTNPTRRFGTQFSSDSWNCNAATLSLRTNDIPVVSPPQQQQSMQVMSVLSDPGIEVLAKCENNFNSSDWSQVDKQAPLRVITMRLMMYWKLRQEKISRDTGKPEKLVKLTFFRTTMKNNYYVTDTTPLRSFFFDDGTYLTWLKNTHTQLKPLLSNKIPEDWDYVSRIPGVKLLPVILSAIDNIALWNLENDDWPSIYNKAGREADIQQMHKDIHDGLPFRQINTTCIQQKLYTMEYVRALLQFFEAYKKRILDAFAADPAEARATYYKDQYKEQEGS
jgi:hypothetical protein